MPKGKYTKRRWGKFCPYSPPRPTSPPPLPPTNDRNEAVRDGWRPRLFVSPNFELGISICAAMLSSFSLGMSLAGNVHKRHDAPISVMETEKTQVTDEIHKQTVLHFLEEVCPESYNPAACTYLKRKFTQASPEDLRGVQECVAQPMGESLRCYCAVFPDDLFLCW